MGNNGSVTQNHPGKADRDPGVRPREGRSNGKGKKDPGLHEKAPTIRGPGRESSSSWAFLVAFCIAVVLKWTPALAPVHEVGHWVFSVTNGIGAEIVDWNHCQMDKIIPANAYGGYRWDILVWGAMGSLALWKGHRAWAGFGYGAANCAFIKAFGSTDFNELIGKAGYDVAEGKMIWAVTSGALILILWIIKMKVEE